MMTEFDVVVQRDGARAVVHVHGELDLSTAPDLRDRLAELVAEGVLDVTVDLAALDFIDSSGLHVLILALKRLRGAGGDLVLRSARPTAVRVFEITGLNTVFTCVNSDHRLGWAALRTAASARATRFSTTLQLLRRRRRARRPAIGPVTQREPPHFEESQQAATGEGSQAAVAVG